MSQYQVLNTGHVAHGPRGTLSPHRPCDHFSTRHGDTGFGVYRKKAVREGFLEEDYRSWDSRDREEATCPEFSESSVSLTPCHPPEWRCWLSGREKTLTLTTKQRLHLLKSLTPSQSDHGPT